MIPFVTLFKKRGQEFSVNPEIVQFVRLADNTVDEGFFLSIAYQLLRVTGTLAEVTNFLRKA